MRAKALRNTVFGAVGDLASGVIITKGYFVPSIPQSRTFFPAPNSTSRLISAKRTRVSLGHVLGDLALVFGLT